MSKIKRHQNLHFEYDPVMYHNELRELCSKAKEKNKTTIELPTELVRIISNWLIRLSNLENELTSCKDKVKEFNDLLRKAQYLYNSEERTEKKDSQIRKLLGIFKQRSLDAKGESYDDDQLFEDYCLTVKAWSETKLSSKELNDKKELIIKKMRDRYNIASREAFIGRLKRGKKYLINKGEVISQCEGVLPKDWPIF